MSSKLLLGFHPEHGKGQLSLSKRNIFLFSFSQTSLECFKGRKQVEWKPSHVGGRRSKVGPGLPLICHMTWTMGSSACSPVLPTLLHCSMLWAQRCQNGQKSGDGGQGCIF